MVLENNIQLLTRQLSVLGFTNIEFGLRKNICLRPTAFQIHYHYVKGADTMFTVFYFEMIGNEYKCLHYDASLRKEINAPEVVINEVNVPELDEKMNLVKWNGHSTDFVELNDGSAVYAWQREETIEEVILSLQKLSSTPEGKATAELLKFKYWSNTILNNRIEEMTVLKDRYELVQRFYLNEEDQQITVEEAYRFLCNRWREKQQRTKNKRSLHTEIISDRRIAVKRAQPARKVHKDAKDNQPGK